MKYSTTNIQGEDRSYFRCPVVADKGKAVLKLGWKKIDATVVEASIGGYTVHVDAKYAKRLAKCKKELLIRYDDTKAMVRPETVGKPKGGVVRVGFVQTQDLTEPEKITMPLWSRLKPTFGDSSTATVAYGGFVLLLFAAMAMPGLGDQLGTSKKIQKTVQWMLNSADEQVDMWSK